MKDRLNRALAVLKQSLTDALSVAETENLELDKLPSSQAEWMRAKLRSVDEYGRRVSDSLSGYVYGNPAPLIQGSNELFIFYEKEYLPRAEGISSLVNYGHTRGLDLDSLLAELGMDLPPRRPLTFRDQNLIWSVFENGLDQIDTFLESADDAEVWHLDEDEVAHARRLLNSEYFRPDEWAENLDALTPILTSRTVDQIPRHVRLRVRELYSSFVFGNWLSVLASGRALLEYALLDRHSPLGFVAYEASGENGSPAPLSLLRLIDNASEKLPELKPQMDDIRSYGNEVLHPKKNKKVTVTPAERNQALDCIGKLREILQRLYA